MDLSQRFYPLQYNEETQQPFLRLPLPPPFTNIIITPPRLSDEADIIPLLNDERVVKWLDGPPYPYEETHAKIWLERICGLAEDIIREIKSKPAGAFIGGCPIRVIREVTEDGREIFLGDIGIDGWGYDDVADSDEKTRLAKVNLERPAGDSEKDWCFGDYLAPSHHGKGIMTCVIKSLLSSWIVPRMGAKKISASAFEKNLGSVRVFEKNGFILEKTLKDWKAISEIKGGGRVGVHVLRWRRE